MIKRLKTLIAAFLTGSGLTGAAFAEPAMWTLSDADTTINIIGTIHYLPEDTGWRSDRIGAAFKAAETVCFEVDAEGRGDETLSMMMDLGLFRNGDRLVDHLTAEQRAELEETAKLLNIPFYSLNVMKPWFASVTIEEFLIAEMELGEGVEFTLYPEVAESGKELCELETPQEQLGGWANLDIDEQIKIMFARSEETKDLSVSDALEHGEEQLEELIEDWLEGDVAAISELINEEAEYSQVFHNVLLVERNQRWVPRIEAMLEEKSGHIFIAVGAAHLAGDDSVITMLRNKGYKVKGP